MKSTGQSASLMCLPLLLMSVCLPSYAAPPTKGFSAQVHTVTSGNICTLDGSSTVLNVAQANGNPNAVIVAGFNTSPYAGGPSFYTSGIITVFYDADGTGCNAVGTPGRWVLNVDNVNFSDLVLGQRFNIIVMSPTP